MRSQGYFDYWLDSQAVVTQDQGVDQASRVLILHVMSSSKHAASSSGLSSLRTSSRSLDEVLSKEEVTRDALSLRWQRWCLMSKGCLEATSHFLSLDYTLSDSLERPKTVSDSTVKAEWIHVGRFAVTLLLSEKEGKTAYFVRFFSFKVIIVYSLPLIVVWSRWCCCCSWRRLYWTLIDCDSWSSPGKAFCLHNRNVVHNRKYVLEKINRCQHVIEVTTVWLASVLLQYNIPVVHERMIMMKMRETFPSKSVEMSLSLSATSSFFRYFFFAWFTDLESWLLCLE